jgi:hypothetical protein
MTRVTGCMMSVGALSALLSGIARLGSDLARNASSAHLRCWHITTQTAFSCLLVLDSTHLVESRLSTGSGSLFEQMPRPARRAGVVGAGFVALTGDLPGAVEYLKACGPLVTWPLKTFIAFPLVYHYAAGAHAAMHVPLAPAAPAISIVAHCGAVALHHLLWTAHERSIAQDRHMRDKASKHCNSCARVQASAT